MSWRSAATTVGKRVTAPMISQGLCAGSSLLLQVAAARLLGLAGYGSFAVCLALLVAATALYSGYVGDSLAVLDRHDDDTRATLCASALVLLGLAFVVGLGTVLVLTHSWGVALLYSVMVVLWLLEETFRRIMIARLEFWRLVGNDGTYALVSLLVVGVIYLVAGRLTLGWIFGAMAVGAAASVGLGLLQVPAAEYRRLRPGRAAMRAVASFAAWRSLHAALRPTALLLSRLLVANLLSLSAVGVLEAGRLVVAPLQTIINGAGSFLLAGFAAAEHGRAQEGGPSIRRLARNSALLLLIMTAGGGAILAALAGPLGRLMTGHSVNPLLVFGWVTYLAVWGVGLPYITEVVARRHSRAVFFARLVDSVLGIGLVLLVLSLGGSLTAVPWLMAIGGLWAVWRIFRLAVRTRGAAPLASEVVQS